MAQALNLALMASIVGAYGGASDVGTLEQKITLNQRIALDFGTTANKADQVWSDIRTLGASANESLDLAGVLADVFGATLTMVEVVGLLVIADAANTNNVIVGGAATNTFVGFFGSATDTLVVKPGGFAFIAAPTNPAYTDTLSTNGSPSLAST